MSEYKQLTYEQRCQIYVLNDSGLLSQRDIAKTIGVNQSTISRGHSGALVTIVERKLKFTLSAQVSSKSAEAVTKATIDLLLPYKDIAHSITADNGKEFSFHEEISKALDVEFYFAHPFSSWERGLNENTNGLLRQYFPKCTDFKKVTQEEVDLAVKELNARPT